MLDVVCKRGNKKGRKARAVESERREGKKKTNVSAGPVIYFLRGITMHPQLVGNAVGDNKKEKQLRGKKSGMGRGSVERRGCRSKVNNAMQCTPHDKKSKRNRRTEEKKI